MYAKDGSRRFRRGVAERRLQTVEIGGGFVDENRVDDGWVIIEGF